MLMAMSAPLSRGISYNVETTAPDYWHNDLYMGEPYDGSERAWNKLIRRE